MNTVDIRDYGHWQVLRTIGPGKGRTLGSGVLHKNSIAQESISFCLGHYVGVLVLHGRGKHVHHRGRVIDLEPGCFYQRLPGVPHETRVESETWLECFIAVPGDLFHSLCNLGFLDSRRPVLHPGIDLSFVDSCIEIGERLRGASEPDLASITLEMQRSLINIVQLERKNPGQLDQKIRQACEILTGQPEARLAVHDVAHEVGMGYESFRKHFRHHIGVSPGEYRIRRRIDAARTLLMDLQSNVTAVAETMGYTNPALFTRQFKRVTGMTPREFRNRQ